MPKLNLSLSKKHTNHGVYCLIGGLLLLFTLPLTAYSQTQLDSVNTVFSVEYNGNTTQGENHLLIERHHNTYEVNFALEHWMLSSNQTASFTMQPNCQVQPLSYASTSQRPFKSPQTQRLHFDWTALQATFQQEDKKDKKVFALDERLYDPLSFFFEARCELMAGQTHFAYPLIYKGNKRTHLYNVVGKEKVETGQGQVEALVIERDRSSKNRQTRLYVAPSLDYLLVKIEHQESRLLRLVATLKSMEYTTTPITSP